MLEWEDETRNDTTVRVQDFRDAVALQFPLVTDQPYFCMGQPGGNVNIWQWKADWQAEMVAWQDVDTAYENMYVDRYPFAATGIEAKRASPLDYSELSYVPALSAGNLLARPKRPSSVEDIIAGGFGTLTSQSLQGQNVQGFGEWTDGRWRVIFRRALSSEELEDVQFRRGKVYSMALAAWDGANDERNGQKSTSQWVSLRLDRVSPLTPTETVEIGEQGFPLIFWIIMGVIGLFVMAVPIIYFRLPEGSSQ